MIGQCSKCLLLIGQYLEQVVGQLICDELVPPGQFLAGETQQDSVHWAKVVQVAGVVHLLVKLNIEGNLSELFVASVNTPFHQGMTKSDQIGKLIGTLP